MEDEEIVEMYKKDRIKILQRGRFSPSMEKGVHHFHKLISEFLVL